MMLKWANLKKNKRKKQNAGKKTKWNQLRLEVRADIVSFR